MRELSYMRKEFPEAISEMEGLKESVDKVNTLAHKLTVMMAPTSVTGGILVIIGVAGAGLTAGASLALTAFGGALLATSVAVTAIGDISNTVNQYRKGKRCDKIVKNLQSHYDNAKKAHDEFFLEISIVKEALKSKTNALEDMEDKLLEMLILFLAGGNIEIRMGGTAKPITNVTRVVFSSVGNMKTITQLAKIALSPTAKAAARALACVGHTFSALGILIDCSFAAYSCYCLLKDKKCGTSKQISFAIEALKIKQASLEKCYEDLEQTKDKLNLRLTNVALSSKNTDLEKQKAKLEEENKKMLAKMEEMQLQLNQVKQMQVIVEETKA